MNTVLFTDLSEKIRH